MSFEGRSPESKEASSAEAEKEIPLEFYITDHSADTEETGSPEKLRELYADIKRDGIESVRYDWHWRNIEPKPGEYSQDHLARYARAKEIMQEAGLKEPTIILSNPPEWAKKLYKEDREGFFKEFADYVVQVKNALEASGGEKVSTVQVLNELNSTVYTPVQVEDIPRLCEITRETFKDYNPDIEVMVTLVAANAAKFVGTPIEQYLPELKKIKDSFDVVAVDYYPAMWHFPSAEGESWTLKEAAGLLLGKDKEEKRKNYYKETVKNMDLLKSSFKEIATWGKKYELGEVGMRTNAPMGGSEKAQRYFYDSFFRAFRQMMNEFREKNIALPSRVGFYEALDEPAKTFKEKALRRLIPFPEKDMGMRTGEGKRKMILEGSPHLSEEERVKQPSQLKKIISYLRTPKQE